MPANAIQRDDAADAPASTPTALAARLRAVAAKIARTDGVREDHVAALQAIVRDADRMARFG